MIILHEIFERFVPLRLVDSILEFDVLIVDLFVNMLEDCLVLKTSMSVVKVALDYEFEGDVWDSLTPCCPRVWLICSWNQLQDRGLALLLYLNHIKVLGELLDSSSGLSPNVDLLE